MYDRMSDDVFEKFAENAERERLARENRGSFTNFEPREEVKWKECAANVPTIVRFVGAPPEMSDDPTTAKNVFIARVLDDNGKQTKIIHPNPDTDKDNLINQIINKIYKPKWINSTIPGEKNTKYYPVEKDFPEIFNWVDKGGYKPEDPQYKFSKGLRGREVLLANVIDRMDTWCAENKHTKLLAKSIYVSDDGREFVEEGISTYGVMDRLIRLITAYNSWETWDAVIIRSTSMNNPYTVLNATTALAEIPRDYQKYVSKNTGLTDEELTYERYDLNSPESIFRPTSYTKIYNRFQQWIKKIDAALETDFYEQLLVGVEREKKERAEKESRVESYTSTSMVVDEPVKEIVTEKKVEPVTEDLPWEEKEIEEKPVTTPTRTARTRTPKVEENKHEAWMDLPYGDTLPDKYKSKVLEVIKNEDGVPVDIKWDLDEEMSECFNEEYEYPDGTKHKCTCLAPVDVARCPICNISFE